MIRKIFSKPAYVRRKVVPLPGRGSDSFEIENPDLPGFENVKSDMKKTEKKKKSRRSKKS